MKSIIYLCIATALIVGCNRDKVNDPIANTNEYYKDKDLQKKVFESECSIKPIEAVLTGILTGGQAPVKAVRISYYIDGKNVTHTARLYSAADCSGDAAYTFEEIGEINIQKEKVNKDGYFIDMIYKNLKVSIVNDLGATAANAISLCGFKDWTPKMERQLAGPGVATKGICFGADVPRTIYNLYRVDANVLYLGADIKSSNTEKDRPTSLDKTLKYVGK